MENVYESSQSFKQQVHDAVEKFCTDHAEQTDFVAYFRKTWGHKADEWVRGFRDVPHAQQDTTDSGKLPPGSKTKVFVAKGFAQTDALSGRRQPHSQLGGRVGQSEADVDMLPAPAASCIQSYYQDQLQSYYQGQLQQPPGGRLSRAATYQEPHAGDQPAGMLAVTKSPSPLPNLSVPLAMPFSPQGNEVMQISGGLPGLPEAALQESAGETQALSDGQTSRQNGCAAALENMEGASFAFGDDAGILNVYDLDLFAEI
ncbi:hypothetical protein WJX82_002879 [Trebouxia sp. C0006]